MPLAYTRLLELCSCDMQLEHSHTVLALCHDLKTADYAKNYAGIIFSGLLLIVVRPHYLHENSGVETIYTGWLVLTKLAL